MTLDTQHAYSPIDFTTVCCSEQMELPPFQQRIRTDRFKGLECVVSGFSQGLREDGGGMMANIEMLLLTCGAKADFPFSFLFRPICSNVSWAALSTLKPVRERRWRLTHRQLRRWVKVYVMKSQGLDSVMLHDPYVCSFGGTRERPALQMCINRY